MVDVAGSNLRQPPAFAEPPDAAAPAPLLVPVARAAFMDGDE
jgi:hypothetical protein